MAPYQLKCLFSMQSSMSSPYWASHYPQSYLHLNVLCLEMNCLSLELIKLPLFQYPWTFVMALKIILKSNLSPCFQPSMLIGQLFYLNDMKQKIIINKILLHILQWKFQCCICAFSNITNSFCFHHHIGGITIVAIVGFELVNKNMKNKQELAYKTNDFLMRINRNW